MNDATSDQPSTTRRPWIGFLMALFAVVLSAVLIRPLHNLLVATESMIPYVLMTFIYFAVPTVLLARSRRSVGTRRELGGACLGAFIGFIIPFLAVGFGGGVLAEMLYDIYFVEICMMLLPVLAASVLFCAIFHPLAEYASST